MGYKLTGDQQRSASKRVGEILRQFGQDEYPYDPNRAVDALQAFSEGRFEQICRMFPSEILASDLIPEIWEVTEDVIPSEFKISDLEFISFLVGDEQQISGHEMRKRAVTLRGNMGIVDSKRIIAGWTKIPKEPWNKYSYIALPGTVLRDLGGNLQIPYICQHHWHEGRLELHFVRISENFIGIGCLARIKSK